MKRILFFLLLALFPAVPAGAQIVEDPTTGGGATTIISGTTPITGGATTQVCYNQGGFLKCGDAGLIYAESTDILTMLGGATVGSTTTAGTGTTTILASISGSSATSNFLNITGTFPATLSAETRAVGVFVTGDNDNQQQYGIYSEFGQSGTGAGAAIRGQNTSTTTSNAIGVWGHSIGASTRNIGVLGQAQTGTNQIGGFFALGQVFPTTSVALGADNGSVAANIFEARDNGAATSTTAASANVTILDGAQLRLGNQVLTGSTMTPTIVGEVRTVTHSYAWTNAMVTALGAVLTGDVTVATLPAKTQLVDALVVVDTACAGTTTLTVSVGDAIGGAPFNNLVLASDVKAAANTLYGDALAERGTAIDTEFYYVPAYAATTLVTARFTATGTNLNTVTTCTGRVLLTTRLLP